jgi:CDP-glycerol glycerophosphotransferase (TagB/SpsB family)
VAIAEALVRDRPDVVVVMNAFLTEQVRVALVAQHLGIPVLAYMLSWDNYSTKAHMVFRPEGHLVWSTSAQEELRSLYPAAGSVPIEVVGVPQFDVFLQERFVEPEDDFRRRQRLHPTRPIITYALGSPNFLQEHHGAIQFAEAIDSGRLGDVQLLVRPHPVHDRGSIADLFERFSDRVIYQATPNVASQSRARSPDSREIIDWVNTVRYSSVVINLASTFSIDAALLDRPVVNIDFDPSPGAPDQELIRSINHEWSHFKPLAESGGVRNVQNIDEMVDAVNVYLDEPALDRAGRSAMVDLVCGAVDGRAGIRLANAIATMGGGLAECSS